MSKNVQAGDRNVQVQPQGENEIERPLKSDLKAARMNVKQRNGSDSSERMVNERMFSGAGCEHGYAPK